ncbi:MAG: His/Gly/Thr/Pro-type tRNA ligase C-terminal domain-containing protein, partial [bacterium]|nr:His/Gly/Thr/Pro-type tRNA ligase C-terminal domain-containing protein [bacterium]
KRLELKAIETKASGGTFSEFSAEFQVVSPAGEDTIYFCPECNLGINKEIGRKENCQSCGGNLKEEKTIEVGNIFPLKEKFAEDFKLHYKDDRGEKRLVQAGCYGLGTSRAMGAIAETSHDEKGIIWPEAASPFEIHLIKLHKSADELYEKLLAAKIEVLYDDRDGASAGEKFADADLVGIPWRMVVSEKTAASGKIEAKKRAEKKTSLLSRTELFKMFKSK